MKKFFFPKSSSNGGEQRQKSPATRDKKQSPQMRSKIVGSGNVENKFQSSELVFPVGDRKVTEKKTVSRTRSLVLRRSRSFQIQSAADNSSSFGEQDLTRLRDWKIVSSSHNRCDCFDCDFQFTDRYSRPEIFDVATSQLPCAEVLRDHACSCPTNATSPRSSFGSTSIPSKTLDLYMDGEHHQKMKHDRCPRSSKECNLFVPSDGASRDYSLKAKNKHDSPRKLAKDVVERLLRIEQICDSENHGDICQMPATVCDKHLDVQCYTPFVDFSAKISPEDVLDKHLDGGSPTFLPEEKEDPTDLTLQSNSEECKRRVQLLSRKLADAERNINQYSIGEEVRNLVEDQINLVHEIYDQLQCRMAERFAAKEAFSLLKGEMNLAIVKLEREKDEVQSRFQKELNRRSDEWEIKLKEFQSEEHRLRDRVRELAEQNVSLQREISGFYNKEKEYTDGLLHMEIYVNDLRAKMEEAKSENDSLQKKLSGIQDKLKVAEEVKSSLERNCKEKERECMELIKVVARLQGTCNEQERTIDGLRQCLNSENLPNKLQVEQLRLTGVEQDLRRQLDTCAAETSSLRSENIYLLERLTMGKVGGSSALKLEQELVSYVQGLQNMGLSLLNECVQMCENLLGVLESKATSEGLMESHLLIQRGMKVQGFRRGLEQLTRSLGHTASVLKEKAELPNSEPEQSDTANKKVLEDVRKSEIEAERLLTSILKEKLYSKKKEVEQMQVELARALRSHDVLKREIQDSADTVSCANHKMKNLELQIIEKDGTINQLQGDIQYYDEELSKATQERDMMCRERDLMWQEVKQYSEKNMLLNREVESLKKKIEALEEDTLLKDGQISILKDSLNNAKSFNVVFDSEHLNEF